MYQREGDDLTLAAAGDAILTRRLSACEDPGLAAVLDRVRAADASVVNLEVLLHDYEGYPAAASGGTYMRAPPWVADELTAAGFDLFAAATNHTGDYSHGGMEATMRELDARNVPYAGLGRHLAEARAPAYADTPAGRVGLVAACSTVTPGSAAGEQRRDLQGRPGLSPVGVDTRYVVPEETLDELRTVHERLGLDAVVERRERLGFPVPGEDDDGFAFLGGHGDHLSFEAGESFGVRYDLDDEDVAAVARQIAAADRQADWVVASLHFHRGEDGESNDPTVPAAFESFARACVDAGADAFVGHGPHVLRGIEVYDGAPVFYSLGNFCMGNETVTRLPADIYDRYDLGTDALPADLYDERVRDDDGGRAGFLADREFWESVLPVCRFADGGLDRVELHPIDLGFDAPRPQRGRPVLAEGEAATRILETLAARSEPFGTAIRIEDGTGVVDA